METDNAGTSVQNNPMTLVKQPLFILILASSTYSVRSAAECQRTATIGEKVIYIDTPDGKKGEGLKKYFKKESKSYMYLQKYQDNLELNKYSKITGAIAAGGVLTGLFYQGNENTRDNIVLISSVTAGVNFLIQKTLLFYNEENLQRSLDYYKKENKLMIQLNSLTPNLNSYSVSATWRF